MQMYALILLVGLAGCLATDEPMNHDDWAQMDKEIADEEDEAIKRSTSPSFDEVRRELEFHAILKHPSVIGLYPRGEEPSLDQEKRALNVSVKRPVLFYRPLCPEQHLIPHHIYIGYSSTLLIRNVRCYPPNQRCAVCGKRYGICKPQYTYITLRVLYNNPFGKPPGWTWYWRSFRITACCQCFYR